MCTPYFSKNHFSDIYIYINSDCTESKNLHSGPYALTYLVNFYIDNFGLSVYSNWRHIVSQMCSLGKWKNYSKEFGIKMPTAFEEKEINFLLVHNLFLDL